VDELSDDARYAALTARDRRFDGVFFVAVTTTGIYCRPVCPARTPGRTRCQFHATAARAEAAGFRACLRCRPGLAPGAGDAAVDAVDALCAAATRRIAEGALDDAGLDDLADELGVSARHLRRVLEARLGVPPVELAQSRRLGLACQLLVETDLSVTAIAGAAGFGSVRRMNATFAARAHQPPTAVRRAAGVRAGALTLRLDYRPPYDWSRLLGFLAARAIPGVEEVVDGTYRRVVHLADRIGAITLAPLAARPALALTVAPGLVPALTPLVARIRRLADLDARPDVIAAVLGRDPLLAPHVAARPGLRLPGAVDPFEAAARAILGQQVSVAAATTLAGRLVRALGTAHAGGGTLTHRFPTAAEVARRGVDELAAIGLPRPRAAGLHGLATAIATGALRFDQLDLGRFVDAACALPGVGPWTAHYLAMRALHLPDAFPAADLGVRKALGLAPAAAIARAEAWRPLRAYAVMHLWTGLGEAPAPTEPR
jgi:AraC family transcriptional regulator of adaptative response / DNA-3-methyladenine glycosylase II